MPIVVAFISQKGGVGKSTLARALAVAAAADRPGVRLADLDTQQRTLVFWGKARQEGGLLPAIAVEAFSSAADAVASAASGELMILDAAGQANDATLALVRRADYVVQPTGPSLDDLRPAAMLFQALANLGVPAERLAFALCRNLTKGEEDATRNYLSDSGFCVLPGAIPERASYRAALDAGRSVCECRDSAASAPTGKLVRAMLEKVDALGWPRPAEDAASSQAARRRA